MKTTDSAGLSQAAQREQASKQARTGNRKGAHTELLALQAPKTEKPVAGKGNILAGPRPLMSPTQGQCVSMYPLVQYGRIAKIQTITGIRRKFTGHVEHREGMPSEVSPKCPHEQVTNLKGTTA